MSEFYITHSQMALRKTGYYTAKVDGDWGEQSHKALIASLGNDGYVIPKANNLTLNPNLNKPLPWIDEAYAHKGMREIKGVRHSLPILNWLKELGAWWRDDETPWCGVFVAHCLKEAKRSVPKHWYRAKAYAGYGTRLTAPAYGCIGVMSRTGGGHVCFVIGQTSGDRLVVIGGNQNDSVSVASYPRSRFDAFVWASRDDGTVSLPYKYRYELPVYDSRNLSQPMSEA